MCSIMNLRRSSPPGSSGMRRSHCSCASCCSLAGRSAATEAEGLLAEGLPSAASASRRACAASSACAALPFGAELPACPADADSVLPPCCARCACCAFCCALPPFLSCAALPCCGPPAFCPLVLCPEELCCAE